MEREREIDRKKVSQGKKKLREREGEYKESSPYISSGWNGRVTKGVRREGKGTNNS